MNRPLLAIALFASSLAGASCPSDDECAALWRWRTAEYITVQKSRSDLTPDQTVSYTFENLGREVLYTYSSGTTNIRLLMVPPVASLYSGLQSTSTCDRTHDTEPYLASQISLPMGFLAKAFPKGPDSVNEEMSKDIVVKPGRMYVDPGNHIEVKRSLRVSISVAPAPGGDGLTFSIVERAKAAKPDEPSFIYRGQWKEKMSGGAIPNDEALSRWMICPWSGAVVDGMSTLGELREKAHSIER